MKLKPFSFTAFIFFLLITSSGHSQDSFENFISKEANTLIKSGAFTSLSIGVIKNGKIYKFHKGALLDGNAPNDSTLYEIASLTKTFTGTLLAKAILDKKVNLDDDIRKYLPEEYPNLEYNRQPITFRHLVTHTSGLPIMFPNKPEIFQDPDWDKLPLQINELLKGYTRDQFLAELHQVTLDTISGHKFGYSNAGANLLGYCMERVYKKPYHDLINTYILKPQKMDHTYVGISNENISMLAKGVNVNGTEMPSAAQKELRAEGGIISNLDDMIKYTQFHLDTNNPLIDISHQEVLNGKYDDFENGLFWQIFKKPKKPIKIFQNGGAFGTSSWLTIVPEMNIGVFVVTNISGPEIHKKMNVLVDTIIDYKE